MKKTDKRKRNSLLQCVDVLKKQTLSPMDLLPHSDFCEKCIDLVFNGEPANLDKATVSNFHRLKHYFTSTTVNEVNVVVFGGGSGLSNIIGGDSRMEGWAREPFWGLKEVFPQTKSIVCVTDDGGSTGEIIKDLPLIAIGDIRHVLLSSIQLRGIQKKYNLTYQEGLDLIESITEIFNHRFGKSSITLHKVKRLINRHKTSLPASFFSFLNGLINHLFKDQRLQSTLTRPHCLGNLILVASIYSLVDIKHSNHSLENEDEILHKATIEGLSNVCTSLGIHERAVVPCSTTPAQLRFCYANGVTSSGEHKTGEANRGYPVENVLVEFSNEVRVSQDIADDIDKADIIILAPGSLYSSIIPIFQVPGLADSVRNNKKALKILVSNLWVQAGETDIALTDPERKFHVSDMIRAYEKNIPGGIKELFSDILCLSMKDVPGSIIQNYALEGKIPIYLDKDIVSKQGFKIVECGIYSRKALSERGVIQHDPETLAEAVKVLYLVKSLFEVPSKPTKTSQKTKLSFPYPQTSKSLYPSQKYRMLEKIIKDLPLIAVSEENMGVSCSDVKEKMLHIIWKHQDIPLEHFNNVKGIYLIEKENWKREQKWDNVYSFFDPRDGCIKIRSDQCQNTRKFETALLITVGQSLLGNYAREKIIEDLYCDGQLVGKMYRLYVRDYKECSCYFSSKELKRYLRLARMNQSVNNSLHFSRVINGNEGFTPPGVLMGLTYAWYLDNRLATHIEYKMALMKVHKSDLIPEQLKMMKRRTSIITFFREVVFSG